MWVCDGHAWTPEDPEDGTRLAWDALFRYAGPLTVL